MADFSTTTPVPGLTTSYTSVLSIINDKFTDLVKGLDTAPTNLPANSIAWYGAGNKWRKWSGTAWSDLSSLYAINISGNAATATNSTTVTNGVYLDSAQTLTNKTITGLKETQVSLGTGSAISIAAGNIFSKTITAATTFTVPNPPASGTLASFILDLTNGGSFSISWWTGVKWANGNAPLLTASGRDVLGFYTYDGGTTWTGLVLGKDVK